MEDNDITMEKYVQRETERALRNDFSPEPTVSPQHIDEVNLKSERLLFEYDDFSPEPTVSPQHIDEVNLKSERLLFEYDGKEQNSEEAHALLDEQTEFLTPLASHGHEEKPKSSNGILKKIDRIMGNLQFNDDFLGSFAIF
uniref:RNA-directed DNA polymerase, eukaryota, reverse transcriptase zinc-binding domain protein n=1 Tax=Tanacetum cinerariifolium TaxID=118510 RepID=A0A6L2PBD0_TANCI|nr:RNA-directed DNA polymerase, eukaryota, reverse transcriptase zinc-binding domain protein [Tanacetum cinerariifolium]